MYKLIIIILFISITSCYHTCPPYKPCKVDKDCSHEEICLGESCHRNLCIENRCGKGKCIPDINKYSCECEDETIFHNNICIPKCNSFSKECRNFKTPKGYEELHECNISLGHCDRFCQGTESCEYGYNCYEGVCKKRCDIDSDCLIDEICLDSKTCIDNPCINKECGKGSCRPHGVLNKALNVISLCECDEDMVLYQTFEGDVCVPKCNGFSLECKNFNLSNFEEMKECNVTKGHCDYTCDSDDSCKEGYECSSYYSQNKHCIKKCDSDLNCEDGESCFRYCIKMCNVYNDCEVGHSCVGFGYCSL